jgi:anti-sigma B factor antagonist
VEGSEDVAFELTCKQLENSMLVVHIVGELDMLSAPQLDGYVRAQLSQPGVQHVVLDLAKVVFLGSSGLAALIALADDNLGVQLHLVGVHGNRAVERPIELMGLSSLFDVHDDLGRLQQGIGPEIHPS